MPRGCQPALLCVMLGPPLAGCQLRSYGTALRGVYACKTMRTGTSRFARTTISNLISHSQAELCDIVGFGCLPWPGVRNAGGSTVLHMQMRGTTYPQRGCPTVCSCDVPLCADAATTCPVS